MNQFAWTPIGEPQPVPVPPPLPAKLDFVGDRKGFLDMVARGAGLELVTLGFYRFWLLTDIRRHLWSNTVVDGDAAEYTGLGRELLIGFLIALAILLPLNVAFFLLTIEAEHMQVLASIPLIAAFYVFGEFAVYRARRYRMTRTVWRGVRFWMTGSGWAYALRASLWMLLAAVTLGLRPVHFTPDGEGALDVTVDMLEHLGSETLVYARGSASDLLTIAQEPHCALVAGDRLTARFRPADALLFDSDSGRRIY